MKLESLPLQRLGKRYFRLIWNKVCQFWAQSIWAPNVKAMAKKETC